MQFKANISLYLFFPVNYKKQAKKNHSGNVVALRKLEVASAIDCIIPTLPTQKGNKFNFFKRLIHAFNSWSPVLGIQERGFFVRDCHNK